MIHAKKMEHAVEHQNSNLIHARMPKFSSLLSSTVCGNSNLAQPARVIGWKREHVSSVISSPKLPIEPAQLAIVGNEAMELPAARHRVPQGAGEFSQLASRQTARRATKQNELFGSRHDRPSGPRQKRIHYGIFRSGVRGRFGYRIG
jgi:hypothetical protein